MTRSEPAPAATAAAMAQEWLLTDGVGGYACGTAADLATRRYHALWVARLPGSARRYTIVAGVDERIGQAGEAAAGGMAVDPASQQLSLLHAHWASLPVPQPPAVAVSFRHRPLPTWEFAGQTAAGEQFRLERSLALRPALAGQPPALLLRWRNGGSVALRLQVRPLLGGHNVDQLPPAEEGPRGEVVYRGASFGLPLAPGMPRLWLNVAGVASFRSEPVWYRGFLLTEERRRGYDHLADRHSPGILELDLGPGQDAIAAFALAGEHDPAAEQAAVVDLDPAAAWEQESAAAAVRWEAVLAAPELWVGRLAASGSDFLFRVPATRGEEPGRLGILAGFPWFGEWGRDVFLALPGLTLARGDRGSCLAVLDGALPFLRGGLLPNIYGDGIADSHYGSCDAALWYALAVQRYAAVVGAVPAQHAAALRAIVAAYVAGTELGLRVEPDGLLRAGSAELNATWMDARTAAGPVTPRQGLPVEIQALWYALLDFLVDQSLAGDSLAGGAAADPAGHDSAPGLPGRAELKQLRDRCGQSFRRRFWLPAGYLADRVDGDFADPAVRPNMVLAAALPRSPLTRAQRSGVVRTAAAQLLTPRGLRTLSPLDPAYCGRYGGDVEARDRAYHQGTVWPWLAGSYVEAALRAARKSQRKAVAAELREWLRGFAPELDRAGLEHLSEVHDGDAPHHPGGTIAQAWSSAELLRAWSLCQQPALLDEVGR